LKETTSENATNNNNLAQINENIFIKSLQLVALSGDMVVASSASGLAEKKILGYKLNAGVLGVSGLASALVAIYREYPSKKGI